MSDDDNYIKIINAPPPGANRGWRLFVSGRGSSADSARGVEPIQSQEGRGLGG
jgi:hypothetical protein